MVICIKNSGKTRALISILFGIILTELPRKYFPRQEFFLPTELGKNIDSRHLLLAKSVISKTVELNTAGPSKVF